MNKSYRDLWENAGYSSRMGSAAVTPPPSQNLIRVYHLTSVKHALDNISQTRMKVARFSDLNDPFELLAENADERRVRKILRNFKESFNSHTGLLCFSANWTNPVLWSHYGAKHRGICLGFNVKRQLAEKVIYKSKRILSKRTENVDDLLSFNDDLQRKLLKTKFRHWHYEEEYRRFISLDDAIEEHGLFFVPFGEDLELAEVILGPLCDHRLDEVQQLTMRHQPQSVTFKARLAFKFFAVVPDERTVP